jgi:dTDP-4-amino-4,6-dideoxygalactose transaminase
VETLIHYPVPPHLQQAFAVLNMPEGALPLAEAMARELISLPIGPAMQSKDIEQVLEAICASLQAERSGS